MVLTVAAVLLGQAGRPNVRIEVRAAPLSRALPELGKRLGSPMSAGPAVAEELVAISLPTAVTAADFRESLAGVFSGEWRKEQGGMWVFDRSAAMREEEERRVRERRIAELQRAIALASKPLRDAPKFDDAAAEALAGRLRSLIATSDANPYRGDPAMSERAESLTAQSPLRRALARILSLFPIERLVDVPRNSRVVFSSQPTRMQRPVPFDIGSVIATFDREQTAWANASEGIEGPVNGGIGELLNAREKMKNVPALATVAVSVRSDELRLSLYIYDKSGLGLASIEKSFSLANDDNGPGSDDIPETFPLVISPQSAAFARAMIMGQGFRAAEAMAPFLDVLRRDPLSYGTTDYLFSYARARERPLIARLSDDLFYFSTQGLALDPAGDAERTRAYARPIRSFSREESRGSWLLLSPLDPVAARSEFFPRRTLALAIKKVLASPRLTVDRQAEVVATLPQSACDLRLTSMLLRAAGLGGQNPPHDLARIYGTLDAGQRQIAASPEGLSISRLSEAQRAMAARALFQNDDLGLRYETNVETSARENISRDREVVFTAGYLKDETFALADGLPPDGVLVTKRTSYDGIRTGQSSAKYGREPGQVIGADTLANLRFREDYPGAPPGYGMGARRFNLADLTIVNVEVLNITLRLPGGLSKSESLVSEFPLDRRSYRLDTLPEPWRSEYLEEYRKLLEDARRSSPPAYSPPDRQAAPP